MWRGLALVPEAAGRFQPQRGREHLPCWCATARRPGLWNLQRLYALFPILAEKRRQPAPPSGGQQQMVALGCALGEQPRRAAVRRTPRLAFAPVVIREIYAAMPGITAEGMTVVIVEQDVTMARQAPRRVCCFQ